MLPSPQNKTNTCLISLSLSLSLFFFFFWGDCLDIFIYSFVDRIHEYDIVLGIVNPAVLAAPRRPFNILASGVFSWLRIHPSWLLPSTAAR